MTLIRVIHNKDNPYVAINTVIAENTNLSWRAKGMWFYAFSRKDDWKFYVADLINRSMEGRDAVRTALKELEKNGYLVRKAMQDEKGRMQGKEWYFYEIPQNQPLKEPSAWKPVLRKDGRTDKRPLITNKDKLLIKEKKTPPNPLKGARPVSEISSSSSKRKSKNNTRAKTAKSQEKKKAYGSDGLVKMTKIQHDKLVEDLQKNTVTDLIEQLNDYIASKGIQYKSHYHTIRSWHRRKKTQTTVSKWSTLDRRTKNIDGSPMESPVDGLF